MAVGLITRSHLMALLQRIVVDGRVDGLEVRHVCRLVAYQLTFHIVYPVYLCGMIRCGHDQMLQLYCQKRRGQIIPRHTHQLHVA